MSIRLTDDSSPALLLLEDHYSPLDKRIAPRPYVYAVEPQGFRDLWRGSALAFPILDVAVLGPESAAQRLCVLHAKDSFVEPAAMPQGQLTMVYQWSGFGFKRDANPELNASCAARYSSSNEAAPQPAGRQLEVDDSYSIADKDFHKTEYK